MLRVKEQEPLAGVFSEAWVFQGKLPTACLSNPEMRCGSLKANLPKNLRTFLDIPQDELFTIKMSVVTHDDEEQSLANILLLIDSKRAQFIIRTQKTNGENNQPVVNLRTMRVSRDFGNGIQDMEPFGEKYKYYLDALKDTMALWKEKFEPSDQLLQCGACSPQENGLPGAIG